VRKTWALAALVAVALAGVAYAEGDLVVTAKWQTEGTDVDLGIIGPDMKPVKAEKDVTSGPGEEKCTISNAGPGVYLVLVMYAGSKGGQKTPVSVEVRLGDKVESTTQVVLERDGEGTFVRKVTIGQANLATTKVASGDFEVAMKWETQGTDIDLIVVGPNLKPNKPTEDVTNGPGQETVTIQAPKPGLYLVVGSFAGPQGGPKTPVSVDVRAGDKSVGTCQGVLEKQGEEKILHIIEVGEAPK